MNKFSKFSIYTIIGVLILIVPGFSKASEYKNDPKFRTTNGYNCSAIKDFFIDAFISANKPAGLMLVRGSCPENVVFPDFKPNELSLKEKLDLIAQMNPKYSWVEVGGVINLAPTKSIPDLLNVKIRSVEVSFDTTLDLALDKILRVSEVKDKLKDLNLRRGLQFGGLRSPRSNQPPTVMKFEDKTLQEILNEIVKKRGQGVWVYNESHFNGENTFSLDFLVQ